MLINGVCFCAVKQRSIESKNNFEYYLKCFRLNYHWYWGCL